MASTDNFDPIAIGRYTVIRAHWAFPNERERSKLFIVLRHEIGKSGRICWCIKPTSKTDHYDSHPEKLEGAVVYDGGVLPFFPVRTIIDPATLMHIPHAHLQREAYKSRYTLEGKMPDDFHAKLVVAVKKSVVLEPKRMKEILTYINETTGI